MTKNIIDNIRMCVVFSFNKRRIRNRKFILKDSLLCLY